MEYIVLSFLLGICAGVGIAYYIVHRIGKMLYDQVEEDLNNKSNDGQINLKIEQHGDILYAFRSDNDEFICQGADLKEIKQQFVSLFPGQIGAMVGSTDELHKKLVEQLKELKNESSSSIRPTP